MHSRRTIPAWGRRALLGLLWVALTLVMIRPTWAQLAHSYPGNLGDPVLITWILAWGAHAMAHDPFQIFDANIFSPNQLTLAYSENLLAVAPFFAVVWVASDNPTLAHNVVLLALVAFTLATTYVLTHWLTERRDVAILAAIGFAFGAFALSHIPQMQMMTMGLIPLGLWLLFRTLDERRMSLAILTGVVTATFVYAALYYAAIFGVIAGIVVVGYLIAKRFRPGARLGRCLLVAAAVAGVLALPGIRPYQEVKTLVDTQRPAVDEWGINARDFLTPGANSYVYDGLARDFADDFTPWEHRFFPGFTVIVFGTVGAGALILSTARRRRRPDVLDSTAEYGGLDTADHVGGPVAVGDVVEGDVVAAVDLADIVDPTGIVADRRLFLWLLGFAGVGSLALAFGSNVAGFTHTPFWFFRKFVPGFDGLRVSARLAVPFLLTLAVFAAVGMVAVTTRLRPNLRWGVVGVLCVLLLGELAAPVPWAAFPTSPSVLAVYHELDRRPPGTVLELPMAEVAAPDAQWALVEAPRMVYGTQDWHPRVNGYSGYWPPDYRGDTATLNTFPTEKALRRARELDVRFVVLHTGREQGFAAYTKAEVAAVVRQLPPGATARRYGASWLVDLGPISA